ncbi:formate dehydrogenase accessory sulfurtransferase FdhD [Proteinivorax tanatarense]|uniref:Sulfur carrier protein FdhD n=1 Tax=Proteinivorax tanatarense TaxID=1260629 RepID=A0AAU7VL42_9FIRM
MAKKKVDIVRFVNNEYKSMEDCVVEETPLTIYINGDQFITLLSTPYNQKELVIGFILSESLISKVDEIEAIDLDKDNGVVEVSIPNYSPLKKKLYGKRTITTGCGKGTIFYNVLDSLNNKGHKLNKDVEVSAQKIMEQMHQVQKVSQLYKETGGVHTASLSDGENLLYTREDIGRHNAVDKILGRAFLDEMAVEDKILLSSGRLSSEIVLKVIKAKIPILVSRSAPSSLAISLAERGGLTLIGFVRGKKLNCYTHHYRLKEVTYGD